MIHPTAIIEPSVTLGDNVSVGAYSVIGEIPPAGILSPEKWQGRVVIGDNVIIGSHVVIVCSGTDKTPTYIGDHTFLGNFAYVGHDTQIGQRCTLMAHSKVLSYVVLEDEVQLGVGAVVSVHCRCRVGSYIGEGSLLRASVAKPHKIYVGRPAEILRARNPIGNRIEYFLSHRLRTFWRRFYIAGKRDSYKDKT